MREKLEKKIWNSEIFISNKRLKNRIVFPPFTCNWADSDGSPNEKIFDFYFNQAKGGSGMIIVEATAVSPEGKGSTNSLVLETESKVEKFKKIADSIRLNDSGNFPIGFSGCEFSNGAATLACLSAKLVGRL